MNMGYLIKKSLVSLSREILHSCNRKLTLLAMCELPVEICRNDCNDTIESF